MPTLRIAVLGRFVASTTMFVACGGGVGGTDANRDASSIDVLADSMDIDAGQDVSVDTPADHARETGSDAFDAIVRDVADDVVAPDAPHCGAPVDAGMCPPSPAPDSQDESRRACTFTRGAMPEDTLGDLDDVTAARAAIQNVVIVVQENHSLDHMFGTTGHCIEGTPTGWTNPDGHGGTVAPHHLTTACPADITHDVAHITEEWDHGAMDGFFTTDGPGAMGYFTAADHPFYTWLITTFATSDHHFCGELGPTEDNRRLLYGASTTSVPTGTLPYALSAAGIRWADYIIGGTFLNGAYSQGGFPHAIVSDGPGLFRDMAAGRLPAVTFIETGGGEEHPPDSIHLGEDRVREVVEATFANSQWRHMVLIITYDEGGGFFDHVPPPESCPPSATEPTLTHYGLRVPLMVISPFARAGYVSHLDHNHSSITRFVEMLHDMPALTARDANSDALLDLFDFDCPPFATPPPATSVPAGADPDGGC